MTWKGATQRDQWTAYVEGKEAPATGQRRTLALGRLKTGEMNKTEADYGRHLELLRQAGEVLWYGFERMTFRLADNTRQTPDFNVLMANGLLVCVDVKGTTTVNRKAGRVKAPHILDDARIKMEVAADLFPIVFKVAYKVDGNWIEKEY